MRYCVIVAALLAAGAGRISAAIVEEPGRIAQVAWLSGCWAQQTGQTIVEEQWMPPRGGTMLNVGRTTKSGTLVEYEFVVLREHDARLAYEAHPSGQPEATFLSTQIGDDVVVFENLTHDFPQRVGYRRVGADALEAWIDGTLRGQSRRVDFRYRRTSCVAP